MNNETHEITVKFIKFHYFVHTVAIQFDLIRTRIEFVEVWSDSCENIYSSIQAIAFPTK